jgi:hypothetical protein
VAFGALALSVQETGNSTSLTAGSSQTATIPTSGLGNVVAASTTSDDDTDDVDASPSSSDSASAAGSGSTVALQTSQNQATDEVMSAFDLTELSV